MITFHRRPDFYMIAALDALIALGWMLGAPHRTMSLAYEPARFVLGWTGQPMRYWGGLLLLLVVAELFTFITGSKWVAALTGLIAIQWVWWLVVFGFYSWSGNATVLLPCLIIGFTWRHVDLMFVATKQTISEQGR